MANGSLMTDRPDWDSYFMGIATLASSRATCTKRHVGAVIVRDKMVLSTGYNGAVRGLPHCTDVGHEGEFCTRSVHAEANAIVQAARCGTRTDGADVYTTASPCLNCFHLIVNAGVRRVLYAEEFRETRCFDLAADVGIELVHLEG